MTDEQPPLLEQLRPARFGVAVGLALVLTADTVWVYAQRDPDFVSRVNPWTTLVLSIAVLVWGVVPVGPDKRLTDVLLAAFGWWLVLATRLIFRPQPHQVTGLDRLSWICVYLAMAWLSAGAWAAYRIIWRQQERAGSA